MKRLNVHFLAVTTVFIALVLFNWRYSSETFVFFGFAENKETEIRLEHSVTIHEIYVQPGERVYKGQLLMEVARAGLQLEQSALNHEVAKLQSQYQIWELGLKSTIRGLDAQKAAKVSEIKSQIEQLESEMSINQSLVRGLESISQAKDKTGRSPNQIKIEGLKEEMKLAVRPLDMEKHKLRRELASPNNPIKIQIEKLQEELGFTEMEEDKLAITAPGNGVIGSVFCKIGEQIPEFSTMLTFYEENPTLVKGYVLESLILHVNEGDSLLVNSSVRPATNCTGKVIGLGSRIVEIPERLRKISTFKTYGREVLIEIPFDNNFLQKERVVLNLFPCENDPSKKVFQAFTPPKTSAEISARQSTNLKEGVE